MTLGPGITIEGLFGEHCSGDAFDHDKHMAQLASEPHVEDMDPNESHNSAESHIQSSLALGMSSPAARAVSPFRTSNIENVTQHHERAEPSQATTASITHEDHDNMTEAHDKEDAGREQQVIDLTLEESESSQNTGTQSTQSQVVLKRNFESFVEDCEAVQRTRSTDKTADEDNSHLLDSQETSISARALETRRTAFNSVLHESNPDRWTGLLSTTNNHTHEECELGEERGSSCVE